MYRMYNPRRTSQLISLPWALWDGAGGTVLWLVGLRLAALSVG